MGLILPTLWLADMTLEFVIASPKSLRKRGTDRQQDLEHDISLMDIQHIFGTWQRHTLLVGT